MKPTDISEGGLETLICRMLTGTDCVVSQASDTSEVAENIVAYGGVGWFPGNPTDYNREYCVDLFQLSLFLKSTQPKIAEALDLDNDSPTRRNFLARLQGEISRRGWWMYCEMALLMDLII
jgi:type I restriction enzyme R subunit